MDWTWIFVAFVVIAVIYLVVKTNRKDPPSSGTGTTPHRSGGRGKGTQER